MKQKSKKRPIKIELIPIYIPDAEFQEKKADIQNLIARMVVDVHNTELRKKNKGVRAPHACDDDTPHEPLLAKNKSNDF